MHVLKRINKELLGFGGDGPQITFFGNVWRKHTAFDMRYNETGFRKPQDKEIKINLSKTTGNLVGKVYLTFRGNWLPDNLESVVQSVSFLGNGVPICPILTKDSIFILNRIMAPENTMVSKKFDSKTGTLFIPFWFSVDPAFAFPFRLVDNVEFEIQVKLNFDVDVSATFINYQVMPDELGRFKNNYNRLIQVVEPYEFRINSSSNGTANINIDNIVGYKEIFWVYQNKSAKDFQYSPAGSEIEIFGQNNSKYLYLSQFFHKNNVDSLYSYSYSLHPDKTQPSGHANRSSLEMIHKLDKFMEKPYTIKLFILKYDILKIAHGQLQFLKDSGNLKSKWQTDTEDAALILETLDNWNIKDKGGLFQKIKNSQYKNISIESLQDMGYDRFLARNLHFYLNSSDVNNDSCLGWE